MALEDEVPRGAERGGHGTQQHRVLAQRAGHDLRPERSERAQVLPHRAQQEIHAVSDPAAQDDQVRIKDGRGRRHRVRDPLALQLNRLDRGANRWGVSARKSAISAFPPTRARGFFWVVLSTIIP